MSESKTLSTAEAELYDRQIRLWGIESQEKLRAANILLIKVRGLGSEIAKDILLCGINTLTIIDDGIVTEEEQFKNFLLPRDSIGKKIAEEILPKAQALNPLVKINIDTSNITKKEDNFFSTFTIVVATGLSSIELLRISKACHDNGVKFICGDNFGMFGYSISDFLEHDFFEDIVKYQTSTGHKRTHDGHKTIENKAEKITVKVAGKLKYPELTEVLSLPEKQVKAKRRNVYYYLMLALLQFRDKFSRDPSTETKAKDIEQLKHIQQNILKLYQVNPEKLNEGVYELIFGEIAPVCSIVGGVIAQEVIKAVSGKEVPIHNVFLLDPFTYDGREECVGAVKAV